MSNVRDTLNRSSVRFARRELMRIEADRGPLENIDSWNTSLLGATSGTSSDGNLISWRPTSVFSERVIRNLLLVLIVYFAAPCEETAKCFRRRYFPRDRCSLRSMRERVCNVRTDTARRNRGTIWRTIPPRFIWREGIIHSIAYPSVARYRFRDYRDGAIIQEKLIKCTSDWNFRFPTLAEIWRVNYSGFVPPGEINPADRKHDNFSSPLTSEQSHLADTIEIFQKKEKNRPEGLDRFSDLKDYFRGHMYTCIRCANRIFFLIINECELSWTAPISING